MKAFLEQAVLLTQSLFYLAGMAFFLFVAWLFWTSMQAQNAYHEREDAKLQQSLRRDDWLLEDHKRMLDDHRLHMERLAR